jgi:mutator family transposase
MRVMSQSPDPLARMHTMTKRQSKSGTIDIKALLSEDEEFLRALVRTALQEVLEAEMTEALGAEKGERAAGRQGYRSGYYGRTLITRSASWSCGFRRIEPAVSRPSYLNGISDRSGRWWPRWPRCTCKGFRPGK